MLAAKVGTVAATAATEATCEAFGLKVADVTAALKEGEKNVKAQARALCVSREKDMVAQADELLVNSQQLGNVAALGERALLDGHPVVLAPCCAVHSTTARGRRS